MSSTQDQMDRYLTEGNVFADTKGEWNATGFDKQDIGMKNELRTVQNNCLHLHVCPIDD
jgi:hypothetical protein